MRILGWTAWVDTGKRVRVYSSKKTKWESLPDDGIIFIMLYKDEGDGLEENISHPTRRESLAGNDYYFQAPHHAGVVYGSSNDPLEEIATRYPGAIIKRGKWVPHELFEQIRVEAITHVW